LPVFTVSARDYVRITRQVTGDGEPVCFTDVNDTGIPALLEWTRQLTADSQERAARTFVERLSSFARQVQLLSHTQVSFD
jgi:hypothetical protein